MGMMDKPVVTRVKRNKFKTRARKAAESVQSIEDKFSSMEGEFYRQNKKVFEVDGVQGAVAFVREVVGRGYGKIIKMSADHVLRTFEHLKGYDPKAVYEEEQRKRRNLATEVATSKTIMDKRMSKEKKQKKMNGWAKKKLNDLVGSPVSYNGKTYLLEKHRNNRVVLRELADRTKTVELDSREFYDSGYKVLKPKMADTKPDQTLIHTTPAPEEGYVAARDPELTKPEEEPLPVWVNEGPAAAWKSEGLKEPEEKVQKPLRDMSIEELEEEMKQVREEQRSVLSDMDTPPTLLGRITWVDEEALARSAEEKFNRHEPVTREELEAAKQQERTAKAESMRESVRAGMGPVEKKHTPEELLRYMVAVVALEPLRQEEAAESLYARYIGILRDYLRGFASGSVLATQQEKLLVEQVDEESLSLLGLLYADGDVSRTQVSLGYLLEEEFGFLPESDPAYRLMHRTAALCSAMDEVVKELKNAD